MTAGFSLLAAGVLAYCVVRVAAEPNQAFGPLPLAESDWSMFAAQVAMAFGTLLWLAGSFLYLLGALDTDPDGPDLYF